jgi:hypothetical protein
VNKCLWFLGTLAILGLTLAGFVAEGRFRTARLEREVLPAKLELVRTLGLTDLSLWTEARYTRHPSQADFFTAFQDHPGALEHFPAGSILAPPQAGRAASPARSPLRPEAVP